MSELPPGGPARQEFLTFGAPQIGEEEIEEVVACLRSGWIGTGPRVAAFEKQFRDYRAMKHAVAVNSCTAGLHLSLLAAGLKVGDEVITTPMTFCATVNAIIHAGLKPVLADVDPVTQNIDPVEIEWHLTPRTRAIVIVHFAGRPCDMGAIMALAQRHNLKIIEDCAHATEAHYEGRPLGSFGDFGCFSFYVTKNMTTGEGGMVVTNSDEAQAKVKMMALHGLTRDAWNRFGGEGYKHYEVVDCGFKYNMTDLQAAIGIHQLKRLEANWERRAAIWRRYAEALAHLPVTLPAPAAANTRHSYHLFTLLIDPEASGVTRDQFVQNMTRCRIGVGVHYVSIPEHPYYQKTFGWAPADFPHAAKIGQQTVSIPLTPKLSDRDVEDVIEAVQLSLRP